MGWFDTRPALRCCIGKRFRLWLHPAAPSAPSELQPATCFHGNNNNKRAKPVCEFNEMALRQLLSRMPSDRKQSKGSWQKEIICVGKVPVQTAVAVRDCHSVNNVKKEAAVYDLTCLDKITRAFRRWIPKSKMFIKVTQDGQAQTIPTFRCIAVVLM